MGILDFLKTKDRKLQENYIHQLVKVAQADGHMAVDGLYG